MRWGQSPIHLCLFILLVALSAPSLTAAQDDDCKPHQDNLQKLLQRLEPVLEVGARKDRYRIFLNAVPVGYEQQARDTLAEVRKQLDAVPPCILNWNGKSIDAFIVTDPRFVSAHYMPDINWQQMTEQINDILSQGTIGGSPAQESKDPRDLELEVRPGHITFGMALLGPNWADGLAPHLHVTPKQLRDSGYTFAGTALHEAAHHWQMFGITKEVDELLALGFNKKYDAYVADPRTKELVSQIRRANTQDLPALHRQLTAVYVDHKLPSRFPNDRHAADDPTGGGKKIGGMEYWAMTIEMFAFQPDKVCDHLSAEEIAWLKANVGDCLEQINAPKRPPCWK